MTDNLHLDPMEEGSLPHSDSAERAVISSVILDNRKWVDVECLLSSHHFYSDRHRILFNTLGALVRRGTAIDLVTLRDALGSGLLEKVGGVEYIASLIDGTGQISNVEHYAKIVKHKFTLRERITWADQFKRAAMNGETPEQQDQAWDDLVEHNTGEGMRLEPAIFHNITSPDILKVPWLIVNLIAAAGLTIIAAHYKTGKTFLMYRLILDALFGRKALGMFPVQAPMKVQLWQFEMPLDINERRFHKLARGMGIDPEEVLKAQKDGRFQTFVQPDISLADPRGLRIFHRESKAFGAPLELVDSLSAAFPGVNINDSHEVRPALDAAFKPLTADGIGVVGLHHKRKTSSNGKDDDGKGSILGSQAFGAAARTVYTLDRMLDDKADIKGRFVVSLAPQGGWDLETAATSFVIADNATGTETTVDPVTGNKAAALKKVKPVELAAIAFADLAKRKFRLTREIALVEVQKSENLSSATAARGLKLAVEKKWVVVSKLEGTTANEKEITVGPNTDWEDLL